jgi:prepilin-type N-terminal cleavage/methylation domain-containing protein
MMTRDTVFSGEGLRNRRRGFTLVEVLCTLTVLLVLLPVTMQGISLAARVASITRQKAEATALAQSVMDELIATQASQNEPMDGEESHRAISYKWHAAFSQWDNGDFVQDTTVQQLDVTVQWQFQNNPQEITLSTLIYIPDPTLTETTTQ